MPNEKILQKKYEGLTQEEAANLIELERSVALDEARPNITKNFLSFVKYVWPEFIEGSNHKHAAKTHKVGVCLILTPGMDDWKRS